jgi:hypothetical protein
VVGGGWWVVGGGWWVVVGWLWVVDGWVVVGVSAPPWGVGVDWAG